LSSILSSFNRVISRLVLLAGMPGKFQICCIICSVSSNFIQYLSNRKGRLGVLVMGVNDNLSGAWSDVAFGKSVRTGARFARGPVFHCCERKALSSLESVSWGRLFEYVYL
jgi:hypothetical protein